MQVSRLVSRIWWRQTAGDAVAERMLRAGRVILPLVIIVIVLYAEQELS